MKLRLFHVLVAGGVTAGAAANHLRDSFTTTTAATNTARQVKQGKQSKKNKKNKKNKKEKEETEENALSTLDDLILNDPDLTTLGVAFRTAGLVGALCTTCQFTAFAPTNDAFANFNQTVLTTLLTPAWSRHLLDVLSFHVTFPTGDDRLLTTDFTDGMMLDMLNGEQLTVKTLKRGIQLSSPQTNPASEIVQADLLASNGVLNKIDALLVPSFAGVNLFTLGDTYEDWTTLQALLELDATLTSVVRDGAYTILAPDNGAFAAMTDETLAELQNNPSELNYILSNHIIPGVFPSNTLTDGQKLLTLGGRDVTVTITPPSNGTSAAEPAMPTIRFNGVPAVQLDVLGSNGIAHRFESLVFDPDLTSDVPSSFPSDAPSSFPSDVPTNLLSIFENLSDIDPELSILEDLFAMTGLINLPGEFTLLAPENDAWFANNDTLALLQNNVAVLELLLRNHLIQGAISPDDLIGGSILPTLGGQTVTVMTPVVAPGDLTGGSILGTIEGRTLSGNTTAPVERRRSLQEASTDDDAFMFNDATSSAVYYAANGIIYKIDMVLFDPLPLLTAAPAVVETAAPAVVETAAPTIVVTPAPTIVATEAPETPEPTILFCINFVCDDGYILVSDAATRPGNDRATCCYFGGICAGAPAGAMCVLGDIGSSLISNPSFEDFSECPTTTEQISLSIGWLEGAETEAYISSFFVQSPTCDDSWYRNGTFFDESGRYDIGSIPQNAAEGGGFMGTILDSGSYISYIATCLNDPLVAGEEYTLTLNAAVPEGGSYYGGDTNGATDLICIPNCSILPYDDYSFEDSDFEVFTSSVPDSGLIGGGDWKAITFSFVPTTNCAAIAIGPNVNQASGEVCILYDYLNLQEGAPGMCNEEGECVPVNEEPLPSDLPSEVPTASPVCSLTAVGVECCETSDCDDPTINVCEANICISKGNPRFTLTWSGDDDLDIHVITPGGFEIYFGSRSDPVSGGSLDADDVPNRLGMWVENIIFPLDGSAPRGNYTYFVDNYRQTGEADAWILEVFSGDTLQGRIDGVYTMEASPTFFIFAVESEISANETSTSAPMFSPAASAPKLSVLSTSEPLITPTQAPLLAPETSTIVTTRPTLASAPTLASEPMAAIPAEVPVELILPTTDAPSFKLTSRPMTLPTLAPFDEPTVTPTKQPLKEPTNEPTVAATNDPTKKPIAEPTGSPEVETKSPSK